MTAIVITKKTRQRSLVQWILPGFRSVTQELREVGEHVFQFLLCEVEFPEHPKKRCYSRIKRQIIDTLTQYGCQKVLIYDPVRTTLKRDLEECGFRAPDAGILKRLLFEKLLEFSMKKREKPVERAALVDYEGNFQSEELLYTLCKKFRYVTLVTTNPTYFERAAERVMQFRSQGMKK